MKTTHRMFLFLASAMSIFGVKAALAKPAKSTEVPRVPNDDILWGTYGKSGTEPLKWKMLRDCDTDHLQAILETQPQLYGPQPEAQLRLNTIRNILKARGVEVPCFTDKAYQEFCNKIRRNHG